MILRSADRALPDPTTSRAVLIGVSTYEKLPNLPSVRNNLGGLAAILRDPDVWGIPAENCTVVLDPSRTAHLIDPIALAAEQARDTLLVYYAGHGLTDLAGELHLTISESQANKPYSQVCTSGYATQFGIVQHDAAYSSLTAATAAELQTKLWAAMSTQPKLTSMAHSY